MTASVDPSKVKFASPFNPLEPSAVGILLLPSLAIVSVPVRPEPSPTKAVAVTVPFTLNPSSTVTSVESADAI